MHMLHRRRSLAARFLVISLLAVTLFAVDSLASPSPAEARCIGQGNPANSYWNYGKLRATETAGADTCNGNNFYAGVLKDESADGYCVEVWFGGEGAGWNRAGQVCGAGQTTTISHQDLNGNSKVYEKFCMRPVSGDPVLVSCGWANGLDNYGVNTGY